MISTRPTLLLVSALAFGACHAQNAVRIADASALVNVTTVQDDHVVEAALAAAGSSEIETRAVMASGNKMLWPAGIRGDSARSANAAFIQDYRCFRVGTFPRDSTMMAIVAIPALENMDMPEAMRPDSDLYMVLPERALRAAAPPRLRPLGEQRTELGEPRKSEDPEAGGRVCSLQHRRGQRRREGHGKRGHEQSRDRRRGIPQHGAQLAGRH
jgi:hypothetical protein